MSSGNNRYEELDQARNDGIEDEDDNVGEELYEGEQPQVVVVEAEEDEDEDEGVVVAPEAVVVENAAAAAVAGSEVEPEDAITVKVKSTDEKNHDIRISAKAKVEELKEILERLTGLPPVRQRLICLGKLLMDGKTLDESKVKDGNFVHLVPKPAVSGTTLNRSSSSSGSSVPVAANVDEAHIAHLREMMSRRRSFDIPTASDVGSSRFSYEDEYELNIWRYRVRVLSMLMLFYYFMALFLNPHVVNDDDDKHPQQGQFKQVKPDVVLFLVDLVENILGIAAASVGLRAAVSNSTVISKKFARDVSILCFVHFINLFVWIVALFKGEIVLLPVHQRRHSQHHFTRDEKEEQLRSIVGGMLVVHPLLWISILSIAYRYHKILVYRAEVTNPPQTQAATTAEQPASGTDMSVV